jgi:hypothetical protein
MSQQVSLSFDVDWVADEVLADSVQILQDAGVKATFFATHKTDVLAKLPRDKFEIGIHPNFNPHLNGTGKGTFHDVFKEAMTMYPDVVGFRSHGVVSSGPIMYHAPEYGLLYESNMYFPWAVPSYRDYDHLVRIPMYWSDYRELLVGTPYDANTLALPTEIPAIMAFHPMHVFINSETPERCRITRHMNTAEQRAARHEGSPLGVRDFLYALLERIRTEGIETVTMREVAENCLRTHGKEVAVHARRPLP